VKIGFLRATDGITLNPDYLITDAKSRVIDMIKNRYSAPVKRSIPSFGQTAIGLLKVGLRQMNEAGVISEYDRHMAGRIVDIMAGGDLIRGTMIPEEYLDELEKEVFIGLCKEQKTQDRIANMLKTGKPLRN
jgi:3-hydroxyacyl-CoA dehydrogenase